MNFVRTIKGLFPRAQAFNDVQNDSMSALKKSLAKAPAAARGDLESAFTDLFPASTREVEFWERQFGVSWTADFTDAERRQILSVLWQNFSGQSAASLESVLKLANASIKVVENIPPRNPANAQAIYTSVCGNRAMVCGNKKALCGFTIGDPSYKPYVLKNGTAEAYNIPANVDYWRNCFFICGGVSRTAGGQIAYIETIQIDIKWKNFIEYWTLKSKGAQTTALLFVQYV